MKICLPSLFFTVALASLAAMQAVPAAAQDDIVILLDRSASMREKSPGNPAAGYEKDPWAARKSRDAMESVDYVVTKVLAPGDYFALVTFGNGTDLVSSQPLGYEHERDVIRKQVRSVRFDDTKTDIVAGVKAAGDLLGKLGHPERRKILMLVTDGENDPPPNSPFRDPDQQKKVLAALGATIKANQWSISLVGLGGQTGVNEIAKELGLAKNRAVSIDDKRNIGSALQKIIDIERKNRIELAEKDLKIRLTPGLFGGYGRAHQDVTLSSYFSEPVEVSLTTLKPLTFTTPGLSGEADPITLRLDPGKPQRISLRVAFSGERPADGRVTDRFNFQFAEGSQRFYPSAGPIEVILPGWWEVYGFYVVAALVLLALVLLVLWRVLRRRQVPELRLAVVANTRPLGEAFTLRVKESFEIANGKLDGRTVPAPGLDCQVAARVTYLGRRKLEVAGVEATILAGGRPAERLTVGLEEPFDLKDSAGKVLRGVTITTPDKTDAFGGSHDSDPF